MSGSNLPVLRRSGHELADQYIMQAPSRLEVLEDRLNQQERNTQRLIERAFKIKEDVLDSLNFSKGTWQEEKHSREMLAEHIRNITAVVNKLNSDIGIIEEQLRARDASATTTTSAVKNLEVHHVATLTDLRGRVVRCDNSISKLSTDLRSCHDYVKSVGNQQQDIQAKFNDRLHSLEAQILQVLNQLDRSSSDNKIQLQQVEGGTNHQLTLLESKTKSQVEDLRNNLSTYHITEEAEREKLEARLLSSIEKALQPRDVRMDRLEKRIDDLHIMLDTRLKKVEQAKEKDLASLTAFQKTLESKIIERLETGSKKQAEDFQRLKRECREGFSTVHDSITNMKTVVDGKRKLLEEQLRKEISHIRKMVVLV
ncbi:protein FAM81A-like [Liolophura sinensis]|uniref:protein FAM81A-like n=1 Tax=Liolophura sinensis TaxID=3198878 RepID=UPI0031588FA1